MATLTTLLAAALATQALAGTPPTPMSHTETVPDAPTAPAEAPADDAAAPAAITVWVQRDLRRCARPLCGGWWIQDVAADTTTCADGTEAERCYVSELDFGPLAYDDAMREKITLFAERGVSQLHGTLGTTSTPMGDLGVLTVTAVHRHGPAPRPATSKPAVVE